MKTRTRRPHTRSVKVLIRPSADQPLMLIQITQDGKESRYWVEAIPADWGRAFRLEKPGTEGTDSYDVMLDVDEGSDSCTCPGHTYANYCKHTDCLRALDRAGKLPSVDGYKPDSNHQMAF